MFVRSFRSILRVDHHPPMCMFWFMLIRPLSKPAMQSRIDSFSYCFSIFSRKSFAPSWFCAAAFAHQRAASCAFFYNILCFFTTV